MKNIGKFRPFLITLFLPIGAGLLFLSSAAEAQTKENCAIAETAVHEASIIRGLAQKRSVPCIVQSRERIGSFLHETIDKKLPAQKMAMEALVYKALGIIPDDYDYQRGVINLYMSQIGGYYDPEEKHFIMADWMPAGLQTTVAVHELTHALQDQYWNLEEIMDPKYENGDELLARSALVEGDATAVMIDYTRQLMGQGRLAEEDSIGGILLQQIVGSGMGGGEDDAPEGLKQLLLFPYLSGLRFTHTLLKKGDYKELNKAFDKMPRSSRAILHPEEYLAGERMWAKIDKTTLKSVDVLKDSNLSQPVYSDTMGEFTISVLLGSGQKDKPAAAQAAAGWAGDLIGIFETPGKKEKTIVWRTKWDTDRDADEFKEAFIKRQSERYKVKESCFGTMWCDIGNEKRIALKANGSSVDIVWQ